MNQPPDLPNPHVTITYCRLCGWLLRASWISQELMSTFTEELGAISIIPDTSGGKFDIHLNGELLWSRKEEGRFPDIKELKQSLRDQISPGRDLGHIDQP